MRCANTVKHFHSACQVQPGARGPTSGSRSSVPLEGASAGNPTCWPTTKVTSHPSGLPTELEALTIGEPCSPWNEPGRKRFLSGFPALLITTVLFYYTVHFTQITTFAKKGPVKITPPHKASRKVVLPHGDLPWDSCHGPNCSRLGVGRFKRAG